MLTQVRAAFVVVAAPDVAIDEAVARADAAGARLHGRVLMTFESPVINAEDTVSELTRDCGRLLMAVAAVARACSVTVDCDEWVLGGLEHGLRAHDLSVLAGELTYGAAPRDADDPARRIRVSLRPGGWRHPEHGRLVSLQIAATDLGAVAVRSAGNLLTAGDARGATTGDDGRLRAELLSITAEIRARALLLRQQPASPEDARRQLSDALRLVLSSATVRTLRRLETSTRADDLTIMAARRMWLSVAASEHLAATALSAMGPRESWGDRLALSDEAVAARAATGLLEGRLVTRPAAFRHQHARTAHAAALGDAIVWHAAGVAGDHDALKRAGSIALTRSIRAAATVALLDRLSAPAGPTPTRQ